MQRGGPGASGAGVPAAAAPKKRNSCYSVHMLICKMLHIVCACRAGGRHTGAGRGPGQRAAGV
eukprot:1808727-Prymnesium_polylepis.1